MKNMKLIHWEMPDRSITLADMQQYGFQNSQGIYMLPLRMQRARELFEKGMVVYSLFSNGIAIALDDHSELTRHAFRNGIFGIKLSDWQMCAENR